MIVVGVACATISIGGIIIIRVVVYHQHHIVQTIVVEQSVEVDGRPIMRRHVDTATEHLVVLRYRNPVVVGLEGRLVANINHIDVNVVSGRG